MNALAELGLVLGLGGLLVGFVRGYRKAADERRREEEQEAWVNRQERQQVKVIIARALRHFPFLDEAGLAEALRRTHDTLRALKEALATVPGVILGTGPLGLPVPWPFSTRKRHGVVVGRTGAGKTSLAVVVIDYDLNSGHNLVIIGYERTLFRDDVLPRIPPERAHEVVYLTFDADCPITWGPLQPDETESPAVCAAELFHGWRQAIDEPSIGGRSDAIARNAFLALTGFPGASFLSFRRFFHDKTFRCKVLAWKGDPQCSEFWETFDRFPKGSELPFLARIDQFTGSTARRAFCSAVSSFSLSKVLNRGILLVDLSGLDHDSFRLLAQLFLARIQVVLMGRDSIPEAERPFVSIVLDEFHLFATAGSEYTFRQLIARSRRMGAGFLFLTQHGGQLPLAVRDEVFGNAATVISFAVGAKDAAAIRRELPVLSADDGSLGPVPAESLVSLPVGSGYARIGTGALAMPVKFRRPLERRPVQDGERIKAISWKTFGASESIAPELSTASSAPHAATAHPPVTGDRQLSDTERHYLAAVVELPGRASGEYAKGLGLNGTRAARVRKSLVEKGYLREHRLARKALGKPAVILEPLEPGLRLVASSKEPEQ